MVSATEVAYSAADASLLYTGPGVLQRARIDANTPAALPSTTPVRRLDVLKRHHVRVLLKQANTLTRAVVAADAVLLQLQPGNLQRVPADAATLLRHLQQHQDLMHLNAYV